jgi:REP-associated tyrosine transposase
VGNLDYKRLTERRRPHFQPLEAILFVTFRLADSIPKATARYYKARRDWLREQLRRIEQNSIADPSLEQAKWLTAIENFDREWFIKFEEILHREQTGPTWMRDERIAETVAANLHRLDGDAYRLDAFPSCQITCTLSLNRWWRIRF